MKKILFLLAGAILFFNLDIISQPTPLVLWGFENSLNPTVFDGNLSASPATGGGPIGIQGYSTDCPGGSNVNAIFEGFLPPPNVNPQSHVKFSIIPDANAQIDLTEIEFWIMRGDNGPHAGQIQISINGGQSFTTLPGSDFTITTNCQLIQYDFAAQTTVPVFNLTNEIVIRIHAWDATPGQPNTRYLYLNDIYVSGLITPSAPLPVHLLSFTGKRAAAKVNLFWATAMEQDNDYFTVERSLDGTIFTEVGRIKGSGTTNEITNYEFVDNAALPLRSYYRLKQTDYDGTFEYSNIIRIEPVRNISGVDIYPNPAFTEINLTLHSNDITSVNMQITDVTGRILVSKIIDLNKGDNSINIPVKELNSGIYFIKVNNGNDTEVVRFIKN